MATTFRVNSVASSSQVILCPEIPELFKNDFLDILIDDNDIVMVDEPLKPVATNPMMDALMSTANRTLTDNGAFAFSSTGSAALDAFNTLSRYVYGSRVGEVLDEAWKEDPNLTLRIIWNLRSIHDGKSEKEAFYRAYGWLYDNHPRTAIANLHLLVEPVCRSHKKGKKSALTGAHGYWKDLLNILALATVDQLSNLSSASTFLHAPRSKPDESDMRQARKLKVGTQSRESRIQVAQAANARAKAVAEAMRKFKFVENYELLKCALMQPKYRALYVAVARLFSEQLIKDIKVLEEINNLKPEQLEDRFKLAKMVSLAGKWAPTPGGSHDRVTNIATAICELLFASQAIGPRPSALNTPLSAHQRAVIKRSYYQRWVLTELRRVKACPEPLMSANRWKEIQYNLVPSICMKNNAEFFFKKDTEGFEKYLLLVESNKKPISGATLLPHELVQQVMSHSVRGPRTVAGWSTAALSAAFDYLKKKRKTQLRVVEAQWKTLLSSLRDAGTIKNSLAICDVSGSMGSIYNSNPKHVVPILPAVSLSLLLASLVKPPFAGGFITFSAEPKFVTVNLDDSLYDQVATISQACWGMNTNLKAVFLDLLLPRAIKNKIKQEDMIKRLFIFSDMQFDESATNAAKWETTYDLIEREYKKAGYEVPQIVYWDLAEGGYRTVETNSEKKGVAMMNGFSPAMLKVFMGEQDEEMEVENKAEQDSAVTVVEKQEEDEFNPINVMKKALMRTSFNGLVVVD